MNWREYAVCRNEDAELFFPVGSRGPALRQAEDAKQVCRTCPVIEQCARWALDSRQQHGIWGGMDEEQRRALLRREARVKARLAS
ncbi:WhiB family transcriptional regulator [Streptomyces sp. 549]|uniref:WhiB family transcriptional regulator n=1 Tax=Streptomyces sp. 549 TaxID=3049076 RepID=UPI0024C271DA|nr:WhiB family transcriptional regulator [Streptomyces sp. 549]MDK1475829.1 WhiB family transcriptional regulator [Streptomyces sp. 549]